MSKDISILLFFLAIISRNYCTAQSYVFKNKQDGYNVYRIPTIVKTNSGKLLAFCEGRKNLFDGGNIDLVMKTSIDNGETWSNLKVLWNDAENTCGNPSPVVDETTGAIIIIGTLNNDQVYLLYSKDEGESWEQPKNITKDVKDSIWHWYATGPVHAIQLKNVAFKNRIIVPCNHTIIGGSKHTSHIIYSDNNGISWKTGGSVSDDKTDECTVVELSNGRLLLNMRNNDKLIHKRKISYSDDGGLTWSPVTLDSTLIEPVCQGSLLRYSTQSDMLLFTNPQHQSKRKNLTLSISYDEGKSWESKSIIHSGKAAYNDIVELENGDLACIYETGKILPYSGIVFQKISADVIKK